MNIRQTIPFIAACAIAAVSCVKEFNENETKSQDILADKIVGGSEGDIEAGSLLLKLDEGTVRALESGKASEVTAELFSEMKANSMTKALPIQPKNMEVARKYGLHQWYKITFDEDIRPETAATRLASSPRVRSIQYNRRKTPVRAEVAYPFSAAPMTRSASENVIPFDDPYAAQQWNIYNDGKTVAGSVAGADIGVKDAWRLTGGDPSVIVAVFDCGIESLHEDLKDAVWKNEKEVNGTSGVDDDGNGFIDDKYGFNFVGCHAFTPDYINGKLDYDKADSPSAIKGNNISSHLGTGHGTHVAGIIGATNGNGLGICSIAGGTGKGDGVRLMTCQIFEGNNFSVDEQCAAAFIYAADNGACIAQCSYGDPHIITDDDTYINGGTVDDAEIDGSPMENAALNYFLDPLNSNHENLTGNIAVFAAGNHQNPYSIYPGALDYVISVTAFGCDFLPGGYSNYGPGCNISAPGGEFRGISGEYSSMILSTGVPVSDPRNESPKFEYEPKKFDPNYVYMQGTSMACPHVSGVVALGISYARKLGKKLTREQLTSMLLTSVNDIDQYLTSGSKSFYDNNLKNSVDIPLNRYHNKMGTGALDAWKFLMAIEGTPSVMVTAGETARIDLSDYCSPSAEYTVSIDEASFASLAPTAEPVIEDGHLVIECTRTGAGKITLSASVGADPEKEDGIGGMAYTREISIVSRPFATENGGWL